MALMRIGDKLIGEGREPLMIAEEGQANQGDISIGKEMCKTAAAAGADGIEFQFFLADEMYVRRDPGHAIYKSRELTEQQIRELTTTAHDEGLLVQVAGLSPRIIEFCADAGADVFCVNATDLTNPLIIDSVAATGKPFWLATLMATIEEIDWAVNYTVARSRSEVGLLHGQHVMSSDSSRGVPADLLQLDCIELFKRRYGLVTGFVDHTATTFVPALVSAKGAAVVTKHLAPKKEWNGPDWVVCLSPEEWRAAREMLRYAWNANGSSKEISQAEFNDRSIHRRGIYTAKQLEVGHTIVVGDLVALRPGKDGIDPREIHQLVGRKVSKTLPEQHQLQLSDLQ